MILIIHLKNTLESVDYYKKSPMKKILLFISITIVLINFSCNKTKNTSINYQYGVEISSDYASVQHLLINLSSTYFKVIYDTILFTEGHNKIDEAIVSYYPDSAYQIVIYYPEWGTNDGYGNWRQGDILIKADNGLFNMDYPSEILLSNFNTDKDTIRADSYIYKYLGENNGTANFSMEVVNGSRSFEDTTGIIKFDANINIDVDLSLNNGNKIPNTLYFSGDLSGTCRNGNGFQSETQESLISDLSCNWMKGGVVYVSFSDVEYSGAVTYSDPALCENWYNLTINDISFPSKIIKPKWVN
ncbi:MAG: hypothetical protein C0595_09690 [Marinilabiliales bacterium]|nr:MAG: hypothetical protein C0595_09690 [Marinilabiliales bacterium]